MALDKVDRKILYELDANSRKPFAQIAKKLRMNRTVLVYRINKLKELGIIKGTFTQINNFALGYYSFRVFLKLGNCNGAQEKEIIQTLMKEKNLLWLSKVLGKWDLDIVYMSKNISDFDDFQNKLMLKYNGIIEDYKITLLTIINDYAKDFLIDKPRSMVVEKKSVQKTAFTPDKIHEKLLYLLSEDATINIVELADKTNTSINTVKKKLQELIKNKIILGFRLLIDTNKLGYQYYKLHLTLRHYTKKDLDSFTTYLESKNFMISTDYYLGGEHYEIELILPSEKEYILFFDELREKFGQIIKEHFMIQFYEELVYRYLPAVDL